MKTKLLIAFLFLTWTGLAQKRQIYQYADEVLVKYQLEIHPVHAPLIDKFSLAFILEGKVENN